MNKKEKIKKLRIKKSGFTLIEILVVIGLIALLAAIVIVAINPARQFAQGRNAQRVSNVGTVLNTIGQRMADNKGLFRLTTDTTCFAANDIPAAAISAATAAKICKVGTTVLAADCTATDVDLRPCVVPTYVPELPVDPSGGVSCADAACATGYNTDYKVYKDSNGRVTVFAPNAVNEGPLEVGGIAGTAPAVSVTR